MHPPPPGFSYSSSRSLSLSRHPLILAEYERHGGGCGAPGAEVAPVWRDAHGPLLPAVPRLLRLLLLCQCFHSQTYFHRLHRLQVSRFRKKGEGRELFPEVCIKYEENSKETGGAGNNCRGIYFEFQLFQRELKYWAIGLVMLVVYNKYNILLPFLFTNCP